MNNLNKKYPTWLNNLVHLLAGVTIGWFFYSPKDQETVRSLKIELIELKKEKDSLNDYIEELQDENHILGSELANIEFNKNN